MLDCSVNLIQPYFLMISTFFVLCSYIYNFYPFYTNILYTIIPVEVWTFGWYRPVYFPGSGTVENPRFLQVLDVSAAVSAVYLQLDSYYSTWLVAPP